MQALLSMLTYLGVCKSKNISGFFLLRVGCHSLLPALEALRDSGELTGAAIQAHKEDTLGFTQNVGIEAIAVNLPYANTSGVLERLRAMNIHNVTHRDVQFIVAAYVHPIINHVCSVWGSVAKTRCHVIFHFDVGLDLLWQGMST